MELFLQMLQVVALACTTTDTDANHALRAQRKCHSELLKCVDEANSEDVTIIMHQLKKCMKDSSVR